jgi:hypothetical protein
MPAEGKGFLRKGVLAGGADVIGSGTEDLASKSKARNELASMVAEMIAGRGPGLSQMAKNTNQKMDLSTAVKELDGKLPNDVASLVHMTSSNQGAGQFDEASMQKARRILNNMMSDAWADLDDVMFECKEFQERNRGTYEQVIADLARLGSQLSRLGELRVDAGQGITDMDRERKDAEERLEKVTMEFTETRFENSREMTIRKNDLAVFDFILQAAACKDSSFIQTEKPNVQICQSQDGLLLNFNNPNLQSRLERLMTPDARKALREALGQAQGPLGLLQAHEDPTTTETTTALPTFAAEVVPVSEDPHPEGQWKKCTDKPVECGLLHDLMSIEWGKFRDGFDELTAEMNQNQQDYDNTKRNINEEITVISEQKTKHMEVLASTISAINADTEEMNEKDQQKRDLEHEFDKTCLIFREKITEILYTRICAVRRVRNELLQHSTKTPPSKFSDCDFSDWVSKTGECIAPNGNAILCDDTCPRADPYKCGGYETMKRDVVVSPDDYGMKCPPLERQKKCGQRKCPVDCLMSQWSGWSKCTKDCESGVEEKTRSVLTKPKNGGKGCDSVQEERPCNTGSCDRDCKLDDWGAWSPCSMACSGGITKRFKKVVVPIRGQGKCPKRRSPQRFEKKKCNTQDCVGDEICIAQQDLVIALDASGSLRPKGYEIVRGLAMNLTKRYKAKYFGIDAIKMGVSLFGNGRLIPLKDGGTTISSAINLQSMTFDLAAVRTKIKESKFQRGFTNMAQAFSTADTILSQGGRPSAQSAVMVISDGKFSFKYQTAEKAKELKDKNIQIYMAPITENKDKSLEILKKWASQPWETNYERIPGLAALQFNTLMFVQKLIVKFCPDAMSPTLRHAKDIMRQYILIHEDGWASDECGEWKELKMTSDKDDCARQAREMGFPGFAFGQEEAFGECYGEVMIVTQAYFDKYELDPENPAPACGSTASCPPTCEWLSNPYFNSYVINPSSMGSQVAAR